MADLISKIYDIPLLWDANVLLGVITLLVMIFQWLRGRPKFPHTFIDTPVFKEAKEVALNYNGNPDIFELMHWSCKYGDALPGREHELEMLRAWACEDARRGTLKTALISGPGGSGKTRLAAQIAYELNEKKWFAGFLPRSSDSKFSLPPLRKRYKGVFIVIDYPEERDGRLKGILKNISEWHKKTKYPTRIVLLTRKEDSEVWRGLLRFALPQYAENISLNLPVLSYLKDSYALEIAESVHDALKEISPFHPLKEGWDRDFLNWCRRDSRSNCIPLFIISYIINSMLSSDMTVDIDSPDILRKLAYRERERLRMISEEISFGQEGVPRLLAIASLSGDLSFAKIGELAELGVLGTVNNMNLDNIEKFYGWKGGYIKRLEPDRFAAAFAAVVLLEEENDKVSKWIGSSIEGREREFCQEIERILLDLNCLGKKYRNNLVKIIKSIAINGDSERLCAFGCLVGTQNALIAPLGIELGRAMLKNVEMSHIERVELMKKIGSDYDDLGNVRKAIRINKKAKECMEIVGVKDDEMALYSSIIHNLSYYMKQDGCMEKAVEYIEEVIKIRRSMVRANRADDNMYRLASSINNYAMYLMEIGLYAEALSKALFSAKIFKHTKNYKYYLGHCYGTIAEILIKMREDILSVKYSRRSLSERIDGENKFHKDPVYIARGHLIYAESLLLSKMYEEAKREAGKCRGLLTAISEDHMDAYKYYFKRIEEVENRCESYMLESASEKGMSGSV